MATADNAIEQMSDKELKKEFTSAYNLIYVVDCYGISDLRRLDSLIAELGKREFEIEERTKVKVTKVAKH